ncbi:hypothetical protein Emed_005667 [Eimeria media]
MPKSSYKPRLGWLMVAVVLLLHSQHDQPFSALAGDTDDAGASQNPAGINDQKAAARNHGAEATLNETVTDADFSTLQGLTGEDKASAVFNEDGMDAKGELAVERHQVQRLRCAKAAYRIAAAVLVLSILGRFFGSSGRAALRKELSHLQKLEALVPVAEKLSAAVSTHESDRLWSAVKAMLPEVRQTLSDAEAKLAEKSRLRIGLSKKPYQEIIGRIRDIASRTSKAISDLHQNARDELVVSQNICGAELSEIGPYQKAIERIMGADYAKAYVTFVESQEAHVEKILQEANQVMTQSWKRPLFVGYRDGPSLLATLHDFNKLRLLASARDTVQKIMDELASAGNEPLRMVVGTEIKSFMHELSATHGMLEDFLARAGLEAQQARHAAVQGRGILDLEITTFHKNYKNCSEIKDLLELHNNFGNAAKRASRLLALPEVGLVPERLGEDKRQLYGKVHSLIKEVANHAEGVRQEASSRRPAPHHEAEGPREYPVRLCQRMKETLFQMTEKVILDAQDAANACEEVVHGTSDQDSSQDLYRKAVLALREDSKATKELRKLDAIRGQGNLLGFIEADIKNSLEAVDAVDVTDMSPKSANAKLITSQKQAIAKDLAAVREAGSLSAIAEAAARIREAAFSIQLAASDGALPQVRDDSKA